MLDSSALNFKDMRRGRKISLLLSKAKLPQNVCSRRSSGVATADLLLPGGCVFPHSKKCYLKLTDVRTERCFRVSPPLPVNVYDSSLWLEAHYTHCREVFVWDIKTLRSSFFSSSVHHASYSPQESQWNCESMKLNGPWKAFLILYVLYFYFYICIRFILKFCLVY